MKVAAQEKCYKVFFWGLSIHSKILSVIAIPYFCFRKRNSLLSLQFDVIGLVLGFVFPIFIFPMEGVFDGIKNVFFFGMNFEFNSFFYGFISYISSYEVAKMVYPIAILFSFYVCYHFRFLLWNDIHSSSRAIGYLFIWYFLWSPIVNPWYFLFILPFAVLAKDKYLYSVIFVPQLSYITNSRLGIADIGFYNIHIFIRILEFVLYIGFFIIFTNIKLYLNRIKSNIL
jgi:hypothetical protein